jgi:hypothetical protein
MGKVIQMRRQRRHVMKTKKPVTNRSDYGTEHTPRDKVRTTLWVAFSELHDDLCGAQDLDHEALVAALARVYHFVVDVMDQVPPERIDQFMRDRARR